MFDFNPQKGEENIKLLTQVLNGSYDRIKIVGMSKEKFITHLKAIRIAHVDEKVDHELWTQMLALEEGTSDRLTLYFQEEMPDPTMSQLMDVLAPFNQRHNRSF
jgi:hypothetical protein